MDLIRKAVVMKVDLKDMLSQSGEVRPIVKVELKSEASGKIDTVYVKEGVRLKKGYPILKIDPTRLLTQKEKLSLALTKAKLTAVLAQRDYENARKLAHAGNISQNKLQDNQNRFELESITLKERQLEYDDIIYQLSKTLIVSPMDGVLISLLVEEGEIAVSATSGFSGGTAIGTVADITKLEVVTQIGEIDYVKIRKDQIVTISMESDANVKTTGKVSFVSLSAKKEQNSNVSNFEVRVDIDSLFPGLVPGINVNVDFIVLEKTGVVGVPCYMVEKSTGRQRQKFMVYRPAGTKVPKRPGSSDQDQSIMGDEKGKTAIARRARGPSNFSSQKTDKTKTKKIARQKDALKKLNLVKHPIKIGETDYNNYEVVHGLAVGDTVIKILIQEE
ncbi:MAG: efflux RND transporter periplasmic adaptor subunit [bacterium]